MKPLVIFHADCQDGFGAAFAAWLKLGDEAEYVPMDYLKATDGMAEFHERVKIDCSISERDVYILDFSLPKVVMEWLFAHARRVVWLDHHKTAFEMYGLANSHRAYALDVLNRTTSPHYVRLDNNKSGAMLAWEYFHPKTEVPMLIQHIDDRDRWQFKLEGSKEFHATLASQKPWTFEQWRPFLSTTCWDNKTQIELAIEEGTAILRAHNQHVQAALKQAKTCAIRWDWKEVCGTIGYREAIGYFANAPAFLASDLGHELANQSGTFGLVWSMAGDGQIHCSLRSNGDYDVSAIAKAFGGGGHRNAAGFSTDINTLMSWLK